MINNETHTIDWILDLKSNLGKRIDPKLIEKVICVLVLFFERKNTYNLHKNIPVYQHYCYTPVCRLGIGE